MKIADKRFSKLARGIIEEGLTLLREDRLWTLWQAVANTRRLGLPALEAGSYRGGSAAFLAAAWHAQTGADSRSTSSTRSPATHRAPAASTTTRSTAPVASTTRLTTRCAPTSRAIPGSRPPGNARQGDRRPGAPHYGLVHLDMDLYGPRSTVCASSTGGAPGGVVILDDYRARKCPGRRGGRRSSSPSIRGYHAWDPLSEQLVLSRWDYSALSGAAAAGAAP